MFQYGRTYFVIFLADDVFERDFFLQDCEISGVEPDCICRLLAVQLVT